LLKSSGAKFLPSPSWRFSGLILSEPTLAQMETFVEAPDEHYLEQKGYGVGVRNPIIGGEDLVGHTGIIGDIRVSPYTTRIRTTRWSS
jgi:hypothetical protein